MPARYGKRHAGLSHSAIYPRIDTPAKKPQASRWSAIPR